MKKYLCYRELFDFRVENKRYRPLYQILLLVGRV